MPVSLLFLCNISSPTNTFFSNVKIWEVSCFYFCPHFHKAFKEKNIIKDSIVLELYLYEEIIACCCECHKEISLIIICSKFDDNLSHSTFYSILLVTMLNFFETMYLCNAAVGIVDNNKFSFEHGCQFFSSGSSSLIFICVDFP